MSKQLQGHLAIISANIIFGLSIPITKKLIDHWVTPSSYTFMRLAVGAIIFWSIGALVKKEKVSKRDLLIIAVGGFFGFVATQLLFATALQYTTPVYFSLIMALTPILVLLMSLLFLKEIFTKNKILGVALSIGGAALIILTGGSSAMASNNKFGIMLSFLAALSYGVYMIVTKNVSVKYKPITIIKWSFLFSAMMLFPFEITALPKTNYFYCGSHPKQLPPSHFLFGVYYSAWLSINAYGFKIYKGYHGKYLYELSTHCSIGGGDSIGARCV